MAAEPLLTHDPDRLNVFPLKYPAVWEVSRRGPEEAAAHRCTGCPPFVWADWNWRCPLQLGAALAAAACGAARGVQRRAGAAPAPPLSRRRGCSSRACACAAAAAQAGASTPCVEMQGQAVVSYVPGRWRWRRRGAGGRLVRAAHQGPSLFGGRPCLQFYKKSEASFWTGEGTVQASTLQSGQQPAPPVPPAPSRQQTPPHVLCVGACSMLRRHITQGSLAGSRKAFTRALCSRGGGLGRGPEGLGDPERGREALHLPCEAPGSAPASAPASASAREAPAPAVACPRHGARASASDCRDRPWRARSLRGMLRQRTREGSGVAR